MMTSQPHGSTATDMSNTPSSQPQVPHHDALIIGSGFSGLCMAIALKKSGRQDFLILEKGDGVGGTWRDNTYPGAACDVPSNMYSFSFEPNPNWSRMYSGQAEILNYMQHCADKYDLMPHVQANSEVHELRWDEQQRIWHVSLADGSMMTARIVVSGVGGLSRPALPKVKGLDQFAGPVFHSADWHHEVDLTDKRVAVIGTGASAIQFVPEIVPQVAKLSLFQRTPPWIVPKPDGRINPVIRHIFQHIPAAQRFARNSIYWQSELFGLGFLHPSLMKPIKNLALWHLERQVPNAELRDKLTPNYTIGCKRVLFSNNYYPAVSQDNVDVIASGVSEVTRDSVIDSEGVAHPVDVVICGTGFDAQNPFGPLKIYDRKQHELRERGSMSAYLGIMMSDAPNLFFLLGPNTGLGHNSIIFMIESQVNFVMQCLDQMKQNRRASVEVRADAEQAFNDKLRKQQKGTVWTSGGCKSWYLDENGQNTTLWPGFTWQYWLKTRSVDFADFKFAASRQPLAQQATV